MREGAWVDGCVEALLRGAEICKHLRVCVRATSLNSVRDGDESFSIYFIVSRSVYCAGCLCVRGVPLGCVCGAGTLSRTACLERMKTRAGHYDGICPAKTETHQPILPGMSAGRSVSHCFCTCASAEDGVMRKYGTGRVPNKSRRGQTCY